MAAELLRICVLPAAIPGDAVGMQIFLLFALLLAFSMIQVLDVTALHWEVGVLPTCSTETPKELKWPKSDTLSDSQGPTPE